MSAGVRRWGWLRSLAAVALLPSCGPSYEAAGAGAARRTQGKATTTRPEQAGFAPPYMVASEPVAGAAAAGQLPQAFLDPETLQRWADTALGRPGAYAEAVVAQWHEPRPGIGGLGRSDTPADLEAHAMPTTPFVGALRSGADEPYFRRPIPRILHLLDFEPGGVERGEEPGWEAFAAAHHYQLRRWSDASAAELTGDMLPGSARALEACAAMGAAGCVTAVARLSLLRVYGGIAFSASLRPPRWQGKPVDLAALMPMRDSVWAAAEGSRFIGGTSLTLAPDVLVGAAQGHPLVAAMEQQVAELVPEAAARRDSAALDVFVRVLTSRVAGGPLQVISPDTLRTYEMFAASSP